MADADLREQWRHDLHGARLPNVYTSPRAGEGFLTSVRTGTIRNGERHCLGLLGHILMDGIYQVDPDLVRAGRQQGHVDRGSTHVRPQPRQVVYVYVEMANPWRCVEGILAGFR